MTDTLPQAAQPDSGIQVGDSVRIEPFHAYVQWYESRLQPLDWSEAEHGIVTVTDVRPDRYVVYGYGWSAAIPPQFIVKA